VLERAVSPGHHGRVLQLPVVGQMPVTASIGECDAPDDLTLPERQVWLELAPHASQNRTLTKATALSFRLLCRNIVLERELATSAEHRGGANHRGVLQRVDAELLRFNLSPCGKAIYEAEPEAQPVNPLAKFLKRG
jgi:hypothetical protein